VIASERVTDGIGVGDLGSTFGGGPLPCAAALATLDVIEREGLIENATRVGAYLEDGALAVGALAVQGRGLLLGLRLPSLAKEVQRALFDERVLTGTSGDPAVLRLLPPLSFSTSEADRLLSALGKVLS
jgi:acetylornithine/succinyldiaminopimelate/putrescine aminotransferase